MINIKIGAGALDLPVGGKIRLSIVSPFFAEEIGYNSQSLSFSLPYTENNRQLLGDPGNLQTTAPAVEIAAEVWLFGIFYRSASLRVKTSGPLQPFRAVLLLEIAPFIAALQGKKLSDYTLGGERIISTLTGEFRADEISAHATATLSGDADSFDYVFAQTSNRAYQVPREGVGLQEKGLGQWVNWYWPVELLVGGGSTPLEKIITNYYRGAPAPGGAVLNRVSICPYIYLAYLIRQIFIEEGYSSNESDDFFTDQELKSLCVYNNYLLDEGYTESFGEINHWKGKINLKNHVPDMEVSSFFLGFLQMLGMGIFEEGGRVSLYSKRSAAADLDQIDWRDKTANYTTNHKEPEGCTFTRERDSSNVNHSTDFLLETFSEPIIGSVLSVDDLPALTIAELDYVYLVRDVGELWKFVSYEDDSLGVMPMRWEFYSFYNFDLVVGKGGKPKEIGALTGEVFSEVISDQWRVADFQIEPFSEFWDLKNQSYGFYLFFYRGLISRNGGEIFPESGVHDEEGRFNYSLYLDGERGIFKTWLEAWYLALSDTRSIPINLRLSAADILNLNFRKKYRIRLREAEAVGYLEKIDFSVSAWGISEVKSVFRPIDIE